MAVCTENTRAIQIENGRVKMVGKWKESDEKPRHNKRCHVRHDGKIFINCFYIDAVWYNCETDSFFDGPTTWRYSGDQQEEI